MHKKDEKVSVVIPAYNEEKIIGRCLEALSHQITSTPFEVVVVDNNSTDKTVDIVKSFANKLNIRVIPEKTKGRSPARRAGFESAQGTIILSTDADTIVPKTWVESLVSSFEDPQIAAVSGMCYINDCSWRINTTFNIFQPLSMIFYRMMYGHFWLSGFNFAIRKEIYEKSGGFDPKLNAQEDTELARRVAKICTIKFVHNPVVLFSGRRFRHGFLRGIFAYWKSYMKLFYLKREAVLTDER